ncbi:tyrosine-type recombinase/integrase [Candidatus Liberibacter sp.]|uniref:tyrosine-type recombinase/integrase n=1 Tax=Candidatus Liberibacter sp. TaxID=34022 RepID=UPI0021751A81|nr:tyrosine-type recombinase/integrase [Candidatus Liberibacter sp.]
MWLENAHDTERSLYYFRKGKGERIRLPIPSDPQFMACYISALSGEVLEQHYIKPQKQEPQTMRWLIEKYRQSGHWASLALNTRKRIDHDLDKIIQKSGDFDYKKITAKHVRLGIESRKHIPASAVLFLSSIRGLFNWAVKQEYLKENPCTGIEKPSYKSDGLTPWTKEDMRLFRGYWAEGTLPRLAFEFFLYTGLRCSDACRASPQHFKGNVFSIKTQKVGTTITVELPDYFMDLLKITPTGKDTFFISTAQNLSQWFRDKSRQAGIKKSAHGIRKLSAILSVESGATSHDLMATYGWKSLSQAEAYTKGADRINLGIKTSRRMADSLAIPEPNKKIRIKKDNMTLNQILKQNLSLSNKK